MGSRRADVAHRGVAAFLGKASPLLEALALEPRQAETGEGAPAVAPEKKGADAAEEEGEEEEAIKYDGARIAFFWAVIMGHDELARVLWQRCRDPLHMAVLGAYLCGYQSGQIAIGEEEVMERAKRLESWAHNAIDHAPNAEVARRVLSSPASSKHLGGLLELAVECEMKSPYRIGIVLKTDGSAIGRAHSASCDWTFRTRGSLSARLCRSSILC